MRYILYLIVNWIWFKNDGGRSCALQGTLRETAGIYVYYSDSIAGFNVYVHNTNYEGFNCPYVFIVAKLLYGQMAARLYVR